MMIAAAIGATPPAAATAQARPELSGTTVVHAAGDGGVTVTVPAAATIRHDDVQVDLQGQEAAFVALVPEDCSRVEGAVPDALWCPEWYGLRLSADETHLHSPTFTTSNAPNIPAGALDVYVLADGPVEVTITARGLSGSNTIAAMGTVRGSLRRLPRQCPEGFADCAHYGFGGDVGSVGDIGLAAAYAWAEVPKEVWPGTDVADPGFKSAIACMSSDVEAGGSSDPADHPEGCSLDVQDGSDDARSRIVNYASSSAVSRGVGYFVSQPYNGSGDLYTGYRAHTYAAGSALGHSGGYGAWGVWLQQGIGSDTSP